jgi:probable F420-dependent oxidoreductase
VAALTSRVELATGVLVLPMRQTVIVAKQAAEIDALSGGRLRLGVGVGHVEREFHAVNEDWRTRGRRIEEQIAVLRLLWTDDNLHFDGRWHRLVDGAGLMRPQSVQRPIPIWLGGNSDAALARAARIADGAMPVLLRPDAQARALVERFRTFVDEAGRPRDEVGLNTFFALRAVPREQWSSDAVGWRELNVTHVTFEAEQAGLASPQAHIDTLREMRSMFIA